MLHKTSIKLYQFQGLQILQLSFFYSSVITEMHVFKCVALR